VTAKQLIELARNRFRGFSPGIQVEVSVALGGCELGMPEESSEHGEPQAQADGRTRVGMAQVVDMDVCYPDRRPKARPGGG
jgi:hypothetical protein